MRLFLFILCIFFTGLRAQNARLYLPAYKNQKIVLEVYKGIGWQLADSTVVNEQGWAALNINRFNGVGLMQVGQSQKILLLLDNTTTLLKSTAAEYWLNMEFNDGSSNAVYYEYARKEQIRSSALPALEYLVALYSAANSKKGILLYKDYKSKLNQIVNQKKQDLDKLQAKPLVHDYVQWRELIVGMPLHVKKGQMDRSLKDIQQFRSLPFSSPELLNSGLLTELIQGHFFLIESLFDTLDTVYVEMHKSIDVLVQHLGQMPNKEANYWANFIFNHFEKHSLFPASEYFSLKMLSQNTCELRGELPLKMEQYRSMKIGNVAPDIVLTNPKKCNSLYEINSKFKLVVFASKWCGKCNDELPELAKRHENWNKIGLEVVVVSLDSNPNEYEQLKTELPFHTYCDYKTWNSVPVKDYFVFATPTLFLLDEKNKIILKPVSVAQLISWFDWYAKGEMVLNE